MAAVGPWMLGEDLTAVTVVGYTVGGTGTLSAGSSYILTAYIDSLNETAAIDAEDIRPVNSRRQHHVPTSDPASTVRLVTIKRKDAMQALLQIQIAYRWCTVSWTEGVNTITTWHSIGEYDGGGVQAHGKNTCSLVLLPADVGTSQRLVT